jgi:alginate O-acetyltransferase complex protein AlgI
LVERLFSKIFNFGIKEGWSIVNILLAVKTFIVASFIWIFFRAETFEKAKLVIKALVRNLHLDAAPLAITTPIVASAALIAIDIALYNSRFDKVLNRFHTPVRWAVYAGVIFCLMTLSGTQKFTFIYFQF